MGAILIVAVLVLAIFTAELIVVLRKKESFLSPIVMVILMLILLFTVFLEYRGSELTSGEWSQTLLMIGLVSLTAFYAISTEKQAKASLKMAEEMSKTRYDTVRPVIDIRLCTSARDHIELGLATKASLQQKGFNCVFVNIGLGPALDVHSHIRDTTAEKRDEHDYDFGVIVVGEQGKEWCQSVHEKNEVMYFDVQYRDVFGRLFESKREMVGEKGNWTLGPLQTSIIEKGGVTQND